MTPNKALKRDARLICPGAPELCDGKDNDCDALTPDNCNPVLSGMSRKSYYLTPEGWLVRAYTTGAGPYDVYLEVLDTNNTLIPEADIAGINTNPFLVSTEATSTQVSLAFDNATRTAYVIYTTPSGIAMAKVNDIKP